MNEKLLKMLVALFESKLKNYSENTLKIWLELLKGYNQDLLEKAITKLIYSKEDFISVGMIHEMLNPKENYNEISHQAFQMIHKNIAGSSSKLPDAMAVQTFKSIISFEAYGMITDDYKRERVEKEFIKLYTEKLNTQSKNISGLIE